MLLQELVSDDNKLKAQIFELNYIHKVIFFNDNKVVEIKEFKGKSIHYIRDYCENYVMRIPQV